MRTGCFLRRVQRGRVAVKLYETVRDLPIISPHGHTDPRWFAENEPFPNPAALLIQPDHYIFRMLYSQGVSLESLGIPQVDGKRAGRSARGVADLCAGTTICFAGRRRGCGWTIRLRISLD